MKSFSDRLKFLRGSKSQAEFARMLGIPSQQTYANYESGRVPKTAMLQKIAETTNVSVQWLLTGETPPAYADLPQSLQEQAAEYGVPFNTREKLPIQSLSTPILFDLIEGMPHHIATATNASVKQRFVEEAETAAKELKRRLKI